MTAERDSGAVLALFEGGAGSAGALHDASELAQRTGARLLVGTLVWQQGRLRCCGGPSPHVIACAVREEVDASLFEARLLLGEAAADADFQVIAGDPEPPIARWVADHGVDVVFVPRRRFTRRGRWVARKLRAEALDVRVTLS